MQPHQEGDPVQSKCKGHKRDGSSCKAWAVKGRLVCRMHGGASPQAKAATERRLALQAIDADIESFGLGGTDAGAVRVGFQKSA
jgi:hypothetical protein